MFKNRVFIFLFFSTISGVFITLSFFNESKSEEKVWNKTSKDFSVKKRNQILDWQKIKDVEIKSNDINIKKRNQILDWQKIKDVEIKSNDINIKKDTNLKRKLEDELFENSSYKWNKTIEDFDIQPNQPIKSRIISLNTLNRSIVFNDMNIGPDISWMFPSGFKWSEIYKFDISTRGHNTRIPDPPKRKFFGWNDGDAVGLISYQFLHFERSSFGFNLGVRSIYEGDGALGGSTTVGEGLSAGFRWDYQLSNTSGIAFGAEQLIHFDGLTDTGRNIYLTASKGWWRSEFEGIGIFPLNIATAGFGTGRMAVGSVKGLCADLLGGSGTEIANKRNLCWAPVFSLASVWNEKLSTFFEYNGRFFLLGSSIAPSQRIPLRGTFALILSDHIDNYKLHNSKDMNWVFQLSLGF